MAKKPTNTMHNVKPITFENYLVSEDGEQVVFELHQKSGGIGHISVNWQHLSLVIQVITRAAEAAAKTRLALGKNDNFDGRSSLQAQLVSGFQVSEFPEEGLKVLSLQSPVGFRCDFAIPSEAVDQLGRSLAQGIAAELLTEPLECQHRPN